MKTFPFTSELGWSVSRYDVFQTCKRKYYYQYYAKHDDPAIRDRAMMLKSMTTVPLEIGNIAHDVMESILHRLIKSSQPVDVNRLEKFVHQRAEEYVTSKKFLEVHYKEQEHIEWMPLAERAFSSIRNIVTSDRFAWILELPQSSKDQWMIEPAGFGETRIEGMKAYCKVDFMLPHEDTIYIMDWKTGKPDDEKHRKQLIGYSLFARYHFEGRFANIIPMVCYVKDGYQEVQPEITQDDISAFVETVRNESAEMKSYNLDEFKNTPKMKAAFPLTENPSPCRFCEYRELCER
jgi:ATP-dependent helicase/DNAse subunit B